MLMKTPQHTYRVESEPFDVTSLSRPDPQWVHVDAHGHEHRWYLNGQPASSYSPSARYELPTLVVVREPTVIDEWGDEWTPSHYECVVCRVTVNPGTTADTCRQFVPGLRSYFLDDARVDEPTFMAAAKADGLIP